MKLIISTIAFLLVGWILVMEFIGEEVHNIMYEMFYKVKEIIEHISCEIGKIIN